MHQFCILSINQQYIVIVLIYYSKAFDRFILVTSKVSFTFFFFGGLCALIKPHYSLAIRRYYTKKAVLLNIIVFVMLIRIHMCLCVDCLKRLFQILVLTKQKETITYYSYNGICRSKITER